MPDETLPPGAYEAADEAFESFRVGDGGARDELEAALLAAAPKIRADEREKIRQLAKEARAVCPVDDGFYRDFADLIREPS
jgi:hypothetical protein